MVVLVIDAFGILPGEPERHAPIAADGHRPCAFPGTLKFMESQARQVHVVWGRRRIQGAENQSQPFFMFGLDAALAPGGEKLFETLVPKSLDRHQNQCNLYGYGSQSG